MSTSRSSSCKGSKRSRARSSRKEKKRRATSSPPLSEAVLSIRTKNEAVAILAILENKVRNMDKAAARLKEFEQSLARLNQSVEYDTGKAQLRVRAAGEEMRGRLGLDPELRWSEVRRMKWGTELDETSLSRSTTDVSDDDDLKAEQSDASSIERSTREEKKPAGEQNKLPNTAARKTTNMTAASPRRRVAVNSRYDEAIKHLDAVSAELRSVAISSITENDELIKQRAVVKDLAEKLAASREQ